MKIFTGESTGKLRYGGGKMKETKMPCQDGQHCIFFFEFCQEIWQKHLARGDSKYSMQRRMIDLQKYKLALARNIIEYDTVTQIFQQHMQNLIRQNRSNLYQWEMSDLEGALCNSRRVTQSNYGYNYIIMASNTSFKLEFQY